MRLGITHICYDSASTLDKCFESWGNLKKELDIQISARHVCFPETWSLGYPLYSDDGTIEKLKELKNKGVIDNLEIADRPVEEQIAWSANLESLKDIDYLFMLNGDEIWTEEEIKKVLEYVLTRDEDYFKVNFKNYCGPKHFCRNFIVPRCWSMRKNGGVNHFYKDDLVMFNNNRKDVQVSCHNISSDVVFPKHYSWWNPEKDLAFNERFVKRKLGFQELRYHRPSWQWNEYNKQLELNLNGYYFPFGIPVPEIFEE